MCCLCKHEFNFNKESKSIRNTNVIVIENHALFSVTYLITRPHTTLHLQNQVPHIQV